MKKIVLGLLVVWMAALTADLSAKSGPGPKKSGKCAVKNVIYMIGDGMGLSQVSMMMLENGYRPTAFDRSGNIALIKTYSANNRVTDSAAAGTALASGNKTDNGMLGMGPDGQVFKSIMERAKEEGYQTGLVVTVYLQHATPGAFFAHVPSRGDLDVISEQFVESGVDVALGGGKKFLQEGQKDGKPLIDALKTIPELYIRTIFTHLAGSDEARHDDFTRGQIALFRELSDRLVAAFPQRHILRHVDNSAGIERFPEAQFDMVRLGIGLYGISVAHQEHLLPVSALKSRIVQIKEVPVGDTVGYGRHGIVAEHPVRTATVPIGYADGLNRRLSCGKWSFIVNGRKAPIIGNICMDTCMIDITGIDAHEGDTVTVFGEGAPVGEMADVLGTIPYEIMTGISTRVKRIYTKE